MIKAESACLRCSVGMVCRPDVRSWVSTGDYIVFVCGRESAPRVWEYYYAGVATMGQPLTHEQIWSDPRFGIYRRFLNVLARIGPDGREEQLEYIHEFHDNWEHRISAPYWLFDPSLTALDLNAPLHIATYDGREYRGPKGGLEVWRDANPRVRRLRSLLLRDVPSTRGLRIAATQRAHSSPVSLGRAYPTDAALSTLRDSLISMVRPQTREQGDSSEP